MTTFEITIERAKKFYQSGKESDRNNMIDSYDYLSDEEQEKADVEISKFLPSWSAS